MTNIFKPGKITIVLDGGAGSSAKGLRGANIWKNFKEDHTKFANNTFMENAAHTITLADKETVHQTLSSITTLEDYDIQYVSPGAVFAEKTMLDEIALCKLQDHKLMIHPNASIVTKADVDYEKGAVDFEGNPKLNMDSANLRIGSTLHGVGAARARRVLRRSDAVIAKQVPSLAKYLGETHKEMMANLISGQSGLGEIAQGYQLSLFSEFYPKTTSRNCSVSAFLDDSLLPPSVVGPVVVNYRTFPIRVNNNKYVNKKTKLILTWDQFNNTDPADKEIISGDSGAYYGDQKELSWDEISERAGEKIFECTSLTKLPRRAFTFSKINLMESLRFNNTGDDVYISVNFMNYVDAAVKGKRTLSEVLTPKVIAWIKENITAPELQQFYSNNRIKFNGLFIGTWKSIDDSVFLSLPEVLAL